MPIDELGPEEVLDWAMEFHARQRAKYGNLKKGQPLDAQLTEFTVMRAEMDANIAIVKKRLAGLKSGRLSSMDEEIQLRSEIAEFEGMRARVTKLIEQVQAEIDAAAQEK